MIGEILSRLMFEASLKTMDLSRITHIPQPTLHKIVTGKSLNPRYTTLKTIADYFSISVEQLKGEAPLPSNIVKSPLDLINKPSGRIYLLSNEMLKHSGDLSTVISDAIIPGNANFQSNCFALNMPDTSMEPLFPIGSILVFNTNIIAVERQYILVHLKNEDVVVFRQLLVDGNDRYLKALNMDFKLRELHEVDIIKGTLIESRNNFVIAPKALKSLN